MHRFLSAGVAKLADALDLGSSGKPWGFKSLRPYLIMKSSPCLRLRLFLLKEFYFSKNSTTLEVVVEKNPEVLEAYVRVKVNADDYQEQFEKKIKEYAKKAFVKGFRQGKVPPTVIKKLYGKAIKVEEVNQVAYESLYNYLRDENLQIFGSPLIALEKMGKIDWDYQNEFEFVYEIGLQPEVVFEFDKDFSIKEYEVIINDTDVDNFTKKLLERFAEYDEKEEVELDTDIWGRLSPTSEEVLMLDEREFTKGKEFFGIIDVDALSETHQSLFLGKKVGEVVTFDLRTVFPNDEDLSKLLHYPAEVVTHIQGEVNFTVNSVSTKKEAELNEEIFKKIFGEKTEITTAEDFTAKIREVVQKRYDISARLETLFNFIQELNEKIKFALPDGFLKKWLASQNNQTMDDESYETFQKGLHTQILIDQLSKQNEVSVSEEDLREYTKEVQILNLFSMGFLQGILDENVLDLFVDRFFENEQNENSLMTFERNIRAAKLLDIFKDKISIEKVTLSGAEFDKLLK